MRRLFKGVVAGIGHYGNCFGIPTVAGEVYFDESYEGNPLVNAFCLGVLRHEQIARGAAKAWAIRFSMWDRQRVVMDWLVLLLPLKT